MRRLRLAGLVAVAAAATSGMQIAATPSALAAPCPDAEVIFARGTTELPGLGPTGDAFVEALRPQLGNKTLGVYAVDYPATTAFSTAIQGIADARTHILANAANCPDTKMVLGGFSQGAAVMGFVTASVVPDGVSPTEVPAPMPPEVADHVAAVALFGKPSPRFMRVLNDPPVVVGPYYAAKAIDLCVDNDLVCDPKGSSFAVHNQYAEHGLVAQGATFVAQKLQVDWAAEAATEGIEPDEAATPAPRTPPTLTPSPLSVPIGGTPPAQQVAVVPAAPVGTGPLPGPAVPPPPSAPLT